MNFVKQLIVQTPIWVICLFIYLMIIAIKNIKPQKVAIWKMFILPVVFIILQISDISNRTELSMYLVPLLINICFVYWLSRYYARPIDVDSWSVISRGGIGNLIQVLLIFGIKYYFGYLHNTNPELAAKYAIYELIITGNISSVLFGNALYYLVALIKANKVKNT